MIMPIDIDKKDFTRDKKGYNSREVDEFLDLIIVDYEKVLNDNRNMAHKIKFLEKQLEESQKSDTAMLDTLETAKRLMADISASAERRAELMMRDAELEAESMLLEAKTTVKKLERLRGNYRAMLKLEMEKLDNDEYGLLPDLDRSDIPDIDKELKTPFGGDEAAVTQDTLVIKKKEEKAEEKTEKATVSDLSESLKNLAKEQGSIDDTIILK